MVRYLLASALAVLIAGPASAEPPEVADILTLRDIGGYRSGLALSPDARTVAVFTRDTLLDEDRYSYQLMIIPTSGGEARFIANAGDAILRTGDGRFQGSIDDRIPAWSPDGGWIAYIARHDERIELWRVRPNGSGNQRLLRGDRDVSNFAWLNAQELVVALYPAQTELNERAARERRLGFFVDERFEARYALFPYADLTRGRMTVVVSMHSRRLRDAAEEEAQALRPRTGYGAASGEVAIDQEGDLRVSIAPATPGDRATRPILALSTERIGAPAVRCTHDACSGAMVGVWIVDRNTIAFERREGHGRRETAFYLWRLDHNTVTLLRREDEAVLGCDDTNSVLICLHESPTQPRRLVAMSFSSGEIANLYDPNPQWARFETTRVEPLDVTDAYGNEGFAHLVYPRGYREGEVYPMVIVQYRSRGFLRGGVGSEYPIHALAARGYFVLSVDRTENLAVAAALPPDEAQVRTELDGTELRTKQTQLESLLRQIEERHIVDASRVAITGFSDGAETAYTMLTRTDLIAVAVVSQPPVDAMGYSLNSEQFRRTLRELGTTAPWETTEPWASWWRENGVINHADRIRAPLLMNLSDNEALTGFPLAVRLAELDRPVEMYIYPGEYHVKWRPQHQLAAQQRALDWIDFWLRGIERDDPAEPGRLERWRRLRDQAAAAN